MVDGKAAVGGTVVGRAVVGRTVIRITVVGRTAVGRTGGSGISALLHKFILATVTNSTTSFVTPDKYSTFHLSSNVRIIRYMNHKT
jgi:hypothetical protein